MHPCVSPFSNTCWPPMHDRRPTPTTSTSHVHLPEILCCQSKNHNLRVTQITHDSFRMSSGHMSRTVTIGEQYHMAKSALSHAQSIMRTPGTIRIIFTISTARHACVPFVLCRRRPSATHTLRIFQLTLREMFPLSCFVIPSVISFCFHSVP